jgi:hypothetical protein
LLQAKLELLTHSEDIPLELVDEQASKLLQAKASNEARFNQAADTALDSFNER